MIVQFVNDKNTFVEVKEYIDTYFSKYIIQRVKEDKQTEGLHHAMKAIESAFIQMQNEYGEKEQKVKIDHTA